MAKTLVRRLSKSAKEVLNKMSLFFPSKYISKMRELMKIGLSFRRSYILTFRKKGL